ncbi:hypothetical protein ACH492_27735 [Streptomyces sp. NPDC019443]|uniref:hypothetical protein n=1 Tax=Streptomyces sp. NPDC019443 TaxID=3365061 RepID=UPI00379BD9B2
MDTGSLREAVAFIGCALPLQELALPLGEADSLAPLMPILGIGDRRCASSNYARKGTNHDFPHMDECGDADAPVSRELRSPGFGEVEAGSGEEGVDEPVAERTGVADATSGVIGAIGHVTPAIETL